MAILLLTIALNIATRFFTSGFFLQTVPPGTSRHAQKHFQFFTIIRRDIRLFRCFAGVNDTSKWHLYCFRELHRCQRDRQKLLTGVIDTSEACICRCYRCRWHQWRHASPVSLIPGSKYRQLCRCQWHRQCMHCQCRWHRWCTSRTFGSSPMPLKEQSVKKQAISRYYFSISSIQSLKESSN